MVAIFELFELLLDWFDYSFWFHVINVVSFMCIFFFKFQNYSTLVFDSSLLMLSNKFLVSHLSPLKIKVISCFMSAKTLFFIVKLHLWMLYVSQYFYILPKMVALRKAKSNFLNCGTYFTTCFEDISNLYLNSIDMYGPSYHRYWCIEWIEYVL